MAAAVAFMHSIGKRVVCLLGHRCAMIVYIAAAKAGAKLVLRCLHACVRAVPLAPLLSLAALLHPASTELPPAAARCPLQQGRH